MDQVTYKVTTEPTTEPLTLTEFKQSLRELTSDFDDELTRIMKAARRQVEHDSERRLITQTVKQFRDKFPATDTLEIRTAPVQSVTSVTYTDTDDQSQTFSSSNYTVDLTTTPPRIVLKDGYSWPATPEDIPNAVTVEFVAGYGAASDVPPEAVLAIIELGKSVWNQCDGSPHTATYDRLMSKLRWTEVGLV